METKEQTISKKYKILYKYVDKQLDHTTIYYVVKKKKKGITMDEIINLKDDEVNSRMFD